MYIYLKKPLICLLLCAFFFQNLGFGQGTASAQALPEPGILLEPSAAFSPALMTGMTIHPENPLEFDFIVDTGEDHLQGEELKAQAQRMVNYFMATLTVPEDEMWVNLSPYEKNHIIADGLSVTEMGRDMLAQDYLLKQLTASLIYPERDLGKKFWEGVYKKAQALYGTTEVPVNTFNKVWIIPDEASVYSKDNKVFITNSHLKVMLECDYLAMSKQNVGATPRGRPQEGQAQGPAPTDTNIMANQIVRDLVVPAITKEINEGKNFANLRQIYNSMILATWYKRKLHKFVRAGSPSPNAKGGETPPLQNYIDHNKTNGIEIDDKTIKEKIYNQYLAAFKKGVFNFIKEDSLPTGQTIPRKYFAGGLVAPKVIKDAATLSPDYLIQAQRNPKVVVSVDAQPLKEGVADQSMVSEVIQLLFGLDQKILEENFGSMDNVIAAGKAMAALKRYDWKSVRHLLKGDALEVRTKMRNEVRTGQNSSTRFGGQLATDILLAIGKFANLNPPTQSFMWEVFKDKISKLPSEVDKSSLMIGYIDGLTSLEAMITLGTLTEDRFKDPTEMSTNQREILAHALELNHGDFKQAIGYVRWILPETGLSDAAMAANKAKKPLSDLSEAELKTEIIEHIFKGTPLDGVIDDVLTVFNRQGGFSVILKSKQMDFSVWDFSYNKQNITSCTFTGNKFRSKYNRVLLGSILYWAQTRWGMTRGSDWATDQKAAQFFVDIFDGWALPGQNPVTFKNARITGGFLMSVDLTKLDLASHWPFTNFVNKDRAMESPQENKEALLRELFQNELRKMTSGLLFRILHRLSLVNPIQAVAQRVVDSILEMEESPQREMMLDSIRNFSPADSSNSLIDPTDAVLIQAKHYLQAFDYRRMMLAGAINGMAVSLVEGVPLSKTFSFGVDILETPNGFRRFQYLVRNAMFHHADHLNWELQKQYPTDGRQLMIFDLLPDYARFGFDPPVIIAGEEISNVPYDQLTVEQKTLLKVEMQRYENRARKVAEFLERFPPQVANTIMNINDEDFRTRLTRDLMNKDFSNARQKLLELQVEQDKLAVKIEEISRTIKLEEALLEMKLSGSYYHPEAVEDLLEFEKEQEKLIFELYTEKYKSSDQHEYVIHLIRNLSTDIEKLSATDKAMVASGVKKKLSDLSSTELRAEIMKHLIKGTPLEGVVTNVRIISNQSGTFHAIFDSDRFGTLYWDFTYKDQTITELTMTEGVFRSRYNRVLLGLILHWAQTRWGMTQGKNWPMDQKGSEFFVNVFSEWAIPGENPVTLNGDSIADGFSVVDFTKLDLVRHWPFADFVNKDKAMTGEYGASVERTANGFTVRWKVAYDNIVIEQFPQLVDSLSVMGPVEAAQRFASGQEAVTLLQVGNKVKVFRLEDAEAFAEKYQIAVRMGNRSYRFKGHRIQLFDQQGIMLQEFDDPEIRRFLLLRIHSVIGSLLVEVARKDVQRFMMKVKAMKEGITYQVDLMSKSINIHLGGVNPVIDKLTGAIMPEGFPPTLTDQAYLLSRMALALRYTVLDEREQKIVRLPSMSEVLAYNPVADNAMTATPGGIDFNAKNLNLKEQGSPSETAFKLSAENDQINGIRPVIIKITPVTNLPQLLGIDTTS